MKLAILLILAVVASSVAIRAGQKVKQDPQYFPVRQTRMAGMTEGVREYDQYEFDSTTSTNLEEFVKAKNLILDADAKHDDSINFVQNECGKTVCENIVEADAVGNIGLTGINTQDSVVAPGR